MIKLYHKVCYCKYTLWITGYSSHKQNEPYELFILKKTMNKNNQQKIYYRALPVLLLVPFILLFFLFQIAPIIWVLINSFIVESHWSWENYQQVLSSKFILQGFNNSLWLALWSSVIGLLIAVIMVNSLRRVNGHLRNTVISFVNISNNFSGVPLAFAFIILLGINGTVTLLLKQSGLPEIFSLYSKWGLLVIYIYFQIPLAVLLLYPAFDILNDDWKSAAQLLGASPLQYILRIAIPVLSPALFGTFIILIANAIGAYASVYALTAGNYNVITVRIASLVSGDIFLQPNVAAAISVLLIVIMLFITLINQLIVRPHYHEKHQ